MALYTTVHLHNISAGREADYAAWYDQVHSVEVTNVPGHRDFSARARGVSPSGIAMEPRSSSGSFARTVHYFRKVSGTEFWPGGIAYGGDLSVYPDKT